MGYKASLDVPEKEEVYLSCQDSNPNVQLIILRCVIPVVLVQ
jgi:hypothetical protein